MIIKEKHIVPPQETPIRLSDYAGGIFQSISSRKGMKKAIQKQWVQVNGKIASTATYLSGGETITLLEAPKMHENRLYERDLKILLEEETFAVVAKPAGLLVSGNTFQTVENALPYNLKASQKIDALPFPLPAHRLDFPTTGVLLVAKTRSTLTHLKQQFEAQSIQKTYLAVVIGELSEKGELTTPIDDKTAHTYYTQYFILAHKRYGTISLLKLQPKTGRRHQLRKQLAEAGHFILGDTQYAPKGAPKVKGLFLHAAALTFLHPEKEHEVTVQQDVPKKFTKLFSSQLEWINELIS